MSTEILNAWCPEMTIEEYHLDTTHDSSSSLRIGERSLAEYFERRITRRILGTTSDPQRLGTLAHVAIVEPEKMTTHVVVPPVEVLASNGAFSGNAFKAWRAEQNGTLIVKQAEYDESRWQADSVWANPATREIVERATIREQNIFWETATDKLKARIDLGDELSCTIVDLKKTRELADFWRAVGRYSYLAQAALYVDGYAAFYGQRPSFAFLLVSDEPPFDCCVRTVPEAAIEHGRQQNEKILSTLRECRSGARPWRTDGLDTVMELDLPPYMLAATETGECEARHEY